MALLVLDVWLLCGVPVWVGVCDDCVDTQGQGYPMGGVGCATPRAGYMVTLASAVSVLSAISAGAVAGVGLCLRHGLGCVL